MRVHALVPDLATAERAVEAGATVVQLRLKGAPSPEVVRVGKPIRELCSRARVASAAVRFGLFELGAGDGPVDVFQLREAG